MIYFFALFFSLTAFSEEKLEAIQVIHEGTSNTLVDFAPSVSTLKLNELRKRREVSLGDTLKSEPGIQSSSFGPNASRPIIRGLDGDRIRILQNGLGVLDASSQSVDHAVPVDTLIIDSIEIVRGPMSMLYGSSAVGGVININTNRIHSVYEEGAISELQLQGDSSQDALSTAAKIDYGVDQWMFHIDGGYRNANNLKVPGADKKERLNNPGNMMNVEELPNSGSVQKSASVGASRVFPQGYLGMSYYFFDNFYGTVADESVDIKMKQNRVELHGEYKLKGDVLQSVRLKTAQSDYGHKEIESGEIGTTFSNEGNETRLELMSLFKDFKGVSGVQSQNFNFSAVGEEAFLPTSRNSGIALFTLQELVQKDNTYTIGARFENSHIETGSSDGKQKNFNGLNGSLGYRHQYNKGISLLSSVSYSERLPNAQELFADGAHLATGIFEQGNEDLNNEKAYALDFGLKYDGQDETLAVNLYTQNFKDYVALVDSGIADVESGFNVFEYQQVDAVFYGFEIDAKKKLGSTPWNVFSRGDLVRGKNTDSGKNLPRISPPRVAFGLEWAKDRIIGDVEAQYNFEQTKTAPNESRTDSFTLLNAGVTYDLIKKSGKYSFFGRFKNILNEVARLHTSTLKEVAPLAGRHIVAGVQYSF